MMTLYVVSHDGHVEKAFKKEKDALKYVFDDEDVGDIHISEVVRLTDGVWEVETCNLE